jgi:superfamily II DNA helicase RecQ
VPPGVLRRIGGEILAAIGRARAAGPLERLPRPPSRSEESELDEVEQELHERLKQWRRARGPSEGLEAAHGRNRRVLLRLATERPRTRTDLEHVDGLLAWQIDLFGDELLGVIQAFERDLASGNVEPRRRGRR